MKKATICHWVGQKNGIHAYQILRVKVGKPGPVLVADLAGAVEVTEFESPIPPEDAPAWAKEWATDEWPAIDWRKA